MLGFSGGFYEPDESNSICSEWNSDRKNLSCLVAQPEQFRYLDSAGGVKKKTDGKCAFECDFARNDLRVLLIPGLGARKHTTIFLFFYEIRVG